MRIFLLTLGTRGDFEFMWRLAAALQHRGHQVRLGGSGFFAPKARNIPFRPIGTGTRDELIAIFRDQAATTEMRTKVERYAKRWLQPQLQQGQSVIQDEIAQADYCVNNLRLVWTRGEQVVPTTLFAYDPVKLPEKLLAYRNRMKDQLDRVTNIVAMNRSLLDAWQPWPDDFQFVGFFRNNNEHGLNSKIVQFLNAGNPPVVVTTGSMVPYEVEKLHESVTTACRNLDRRCIIIKSWSAASAYEADHSHSGDVENQILITHEAPYEKLFPAAACVVHHGGCGTVASTLFAGVPSVIVPQISSQTHFGEILKRQSLAADVIPESEITPTRMLAALKSAMSGECRSAAEHWAAQTADDRGADHAAELIENHAARCGC